MRIAALISGSGTNLQAMLDAGLPIAVVLSDRPGVAGLARAEAAGLPTVVVDRARWLPDRAAFTDAVLAALAPHRIDLIAMAGFMTILDAAIFATYPERIVNTHPSLLPAFRGAHAVRDALAAGVTETGCTIHYATPEVDAGPVLAQRVVPVLPGDTEATLHERIKDAERSLYPEVLTRLVAEAAAAAEAHSG